MSFKFLRSRIKSLTSRRHCCNGHGLVHLPNDEPIIMLVIPPAANGASPADQRSKTHQQSEISRTSTELQGKHPNHFMVHHLSGPVAPLAAYQGSVVSFAQPSHFRQRSHPPPLEALVSMCRAVQSWIQIDGENVAVLACEESQAALVASCMLVYCNLLPTAANAGREYLNLCTHFSRAGYSSCVPLRAHHVYLRHFHRLAQKARAASALALGQAGSAGVRAAAAGPTTPSAAAPTARASSWLSVSPMHDEAARWKLHSVRLTACPNMGGTGSCRPFVMLIRNDQVLFTSMAGVVRSREAGQPVSFPVNVRAEGDLVLRLYHLPAGQQGQLLLSFAFHTVFASVRGSSGLLRIKGGDLDAIANDTTGCFPKDLVFEIKFARDADGGPGSATDGPLGLSTATSAGTSPASNPVLDTSNDEEFARELQEQFDREASLQRLAVAEAASTAASAAGTDDDPAQGSEAQDGDAAVAPEPEAGDTSSSPSPAATSPVAVAASAAAAAADAAADAGNVLPSPPSIGREASVVSLSPSPSPAATTAVAASPTPPTPATEQLSADEAFARQLQEQFDREQQEMLVRERQAREAREAGGDAGSGRRHRDGRLRRHNRQRRASLPSSASPSSPSSPSSTDSSDDALEPPPRTEGAAAGAVGVSGAGAGASAEDQALAERLQQMLFLEELMSQDDGSGSSRMMRTLIAGHHQRRHSMARISALPTSKITPSQLAGALEGKECQICCEDYSINDELKTLPCLHYFHCHCIDMWLHQKPTCPVCLLPITAESSFS
eukprot:m.121455 g.121455  ORF g.121455 m.121455 type:complete len:781 (-) comp16538_c1_seq1:100-2442(-)